MKEVAEMKLTTIDQLVSHQETPSVSISGKLLEGPGNSAIVEHLIVNKLKLHDQHDFHPSQSIDKDPIDTYDYVTKLIDLGSSIEMILLDLTKVSDKYATGD